MEAGDSKGEEDSAINASERYYCPFPGCKRSFAELWRLKVHYRAPPDIRGSGKERGHGTELTHCPKCGKGLKPGKHHVGCSGGKAPRQAKRQRGAAANTMVAQEGMNGDAQAMYGSCMMMPGAYGQGMAAGMPPNGYTSAYGQQYAAFPQQQQYQPDMPGSFYQGPQHPMAGGVMQQQPQVQQQQQQQPSGIHSPTLGMGLGQEQLNSTGSAAQQLLQTGSGDMLLGNPQGFQYQQQVMPPPQQQQQLMQMQQPQEQQELLQPHHHEQLQLQQPVVDVLESSHLQQPPQQQVLLQSQVKQEPVSMAPATTASGAFLAQQQQAHQQMLLPQDQAYLNQDAAEAGLMPPPPPVPMAHMQQQQQPAEGQQQHQQMLPPPPTQPQPVAPLGQITSTLFDDIDNMSAAAACSASSSAATTEPQHTRAPSPPPLPADFPQATPGMGTLFNFAQFSQKLPAAQGPSQQMAMMPRGMEAELPPSMDELWTPEATYDHHSDGDLMQLLFGAPEQPPTMATIHLHHFLEDDACSSPLLTGLLGGSMDDLRAAEAKMGGGAGAGGHTAAAGAGAPAAAVGAAPAGATEAAAAAAAAVPAIMKPVLNASTAGMMLPPPAMPLEQQQPQGGLHHYHYQQHQSLLAPKLEQQQLQQQPLPPAGLVPGVNGVIHSQCGASATIQLQVHMQVHSSDAAAAAAPGMVQIKGEDGCLLKAAVPSLPGPVASRAT